MKFEWCLTASFSRGPKPDFRTMHPADTSLASWVTPGSDCSYADQADFQLCFSAHSRIQLARKQLQCFSRKSWGPGQALATAEAGQGAGRVAGRRGGSGSKKRVTKFGVCTADRADSQHWFHLLPLTKQGKGNHLTKRDLLRGSNLRGKAKLSSPRFGSDSSLREALIADPGPTTLLCPGGVPPSSLRSGSAGRERGRTTVQFQCFFSKQTKPPSLTCSNKNGSNSISINAEGKK